MSEWKTVRVEGRGPELSNLPKWRELFPEGRVIIYEGNDPEGFCRDIREQFGFDPSADPRWNEDPWDGGPMTALWFHCPPEWLDAIYGSGKFRVGS